MTPLSFLRTVFAGVEEGYAVAFNLHGSRASRSVPVDDLEPLAHWIEGTHALYSVGVYGKALEPGRGRGTADDVCAITMLWCDVDTDAGSHSKPAPPHAHALATLQALEVPPSLIVDSGGGLHAYWMLREPWTLLDARERIDAREAVRTLQRAVSTAMGWALDDTSDLARILRVPGTVSHKYSPPREVRAIGGTKRRHEVADLVAWAEGVCTAGEAPTPVAKADGPVGRHDAIRAVICACIERGESIEYTVGEVLRYDQEHHAVPCFTDPQSSAYKSPDPMVNALAFVSSVSLSVARKGTGDRLRVGAPAPVDALPDPTPDAPKAPSAFHRWDVRTAFAGDAPAMQWLVERVYPYGVPCMLAAMGDAGKSMMLLDLALKVAGVTGDEPCQWAGGTVIARGGVAFVTSEDDAGEVHRRIEAIDPDRRRLAMPHLCAVVPLPSSGGPLPLVVKGVKGPELSPRFASLVDHLGRIPDLRLVVFDPLSSFAHIDVNSDPVAGSYLTTMLAELAAKLKATVIVAHHMRKTPTPIESPEGARDAIRGTTALVDGLRSVYALWAAADQKGVPGSRFCGAVVKANGPTSRYVRAYERDKRSGLLVDRTDEDAAAKADARDRADEAIVALVAAFAREGRPLANTGARSVYAVRGEAPELSGMPRTKLEHAVDRLVREGFIRRGDGANGDRGCLYPAASQ